MIGRIRLNTLLPLFLLAGVLTGVASPAAAQVYTQQDRLRIADDARRLVQEKYLTNLEILTHYEAHQPPEALQNHIRGLVRDAFRSRDVLVYNEFRQTGANYTTVDEYVKDSRIYTGGKPVVNTLTLADGRYDLQQTKDGQSFINLYLHKQMEGTDRQGRPFQFRYLAEFRISFLFDQKLNTYHNYRIVGISKADSWPPMAFTITAAEVEQAATAQKDLPAVLTVLADQINGQLPANARELTVEMFTYQGCGVHDALSDRIFATLSRCLQKQTMVNVLSTAQSRENALALRGSYQQALNNLQLTVDLYEPRTGRVLRTFVNADLPLTWLSQQNLTLKPDNYPQIAAIRDTLRQKPPAAQTALTVSVRTDRGRLGVEYWEGNTLILEAKANRPCHVRVVYLQADGSKTLLENDFEIKPGQENQYVRIAPNDSFECAAPFGMEHLLAYAADEAFCPLPTNPNPTLYIRNEAGNMIFVGSMLAMIEAVTCTKNQREVAQDRLQITTRNLRN
jgi:hypothetical protein